ncbi:hypothetical protein V6N12_050087 [Hibiscus sabdariffa]|uniref:Reverse transcriptase domain-containing protein n=1 Tax=Hibiscus sabdariffa TaxID=183260 RepID=A0ABR2GBE2_9ROSI
MCKLPTTRIIRAYTSPIVLRRTASLRDEDDRCRKWRSTCQHDTKSTRELISTMAANSQQFSCEPSRWVHEINHPTDCCPCLQEEAQVNAVNFPGPPQRPYNPYSNSYNPGWKVHPNFSYAQNQKPNQVYKQKLTQQQQYQHPKASLESIVERLALSQEKFQNRTKTHPQEIDKQISQLAQTMGRLESQDFYVIRMEHDRLNASSEILLGRPFLGTSNTKIEAPKLELKQLPEHLMYAFLGENETLHVIVSNKLTKAEENDLVIVLRAHKEAIGWTLADIKGLSPSTSMHKINTEEGVRPSREGQHRLNPPMMEVVKKEIQKILDAYIIYPISDSNWVSPIHVVPKKTGFTVIENSEGELVPTRVQNGWRVCIDYRKLNSVTRKDHFPLPFIDQMIERLAEKSHYCCLDGFSVFFPNPMAPKDQEKTTFTFNAFSGENETLPVIVSNKLTKAAKNDLVIVLRAHKEAIGWNLADIERHSPSTCMYKINTEEGARPSREGQRRLNPPMMEVVKKEIQKLLDTDIIYPISDSNWVSPIHVVPKKTGVTVIENSEGELVPTRVQNGWRVCIDYRKLNSLTRKDHFPLPFIDQMIER